MDEKNKAFEKLVEGIRKDNRQMTIFFGLIGVLCLGSSVAAFLGILPTAIYAEEAAAAEREWEMFIYLALGAVGLVIVAAVIRAIIRPNSPRSPEDFWSDMSDNL